VVICAWQKGELEGHKSLLRHKSIRKCELGHGRTQTSLYLPASRTEYLESVKVSGDLNGNVGTNYLAREPSSGHRSVGID
jgi:hypothetical protein